MLPAILGSAALDYMRQQGENRERKKQARANIYAQSAQKFNAPTYNVGAAEVGHANRMGNMRVAEQAATRLADYLGTAGAGATAKPQTALDQDLQNNPPMPAGQYAGRQMMGGQMMNAGAPESQDDDWTGEALGELNRQNDEITGYKDEDDALASIGIY